MYTIVASPAFTRDYRKLPDEVRRQVDRQILRLRDDPHHPSLRTHKHRGEGDLWQARITKNFRLYFSMAGDVLLLEGVGPHDK